MNPFNLFTGITIEDTHARGGNRELIYDCDYDECRYYLNWKNADSINVVFAGGERMPLKQALEERRFTVEEAFASGLSISMVPSDNPLSGEFTVLHHMYTFELNGEAFYPSKSFMYVSENAQVYYDIDELALLLEWYGYDVEADKLRQDVSQSDIITIARGNYVSDEVLTEAGIESKVGWYFSSHTPVWFRTKG